MVLTEQILTVFTFWGVWQFKELILIVSTLRGCGQF